MQDHSPSEWISRARILCLLTANGLSSPRLTDDAGAVPFHAEAVDAMTVGLEPFRFRSTARCASRGNRRPSNAACLLGDRARAHATQQRENDGPHAL